MRKLLHCALAVCLLLAAVLPQALPVSADNNDRYGYSLLTNENQRIAYKAIAEGIAALDSEISFTIQGITAENIDDVGADVDQAVQMVISDYPEYFWISLNQDFGSIGIVGTTVTVKPAAYTVNGQVVTAGSPELQTAKDKLESVISAAFAKLPNNPSNYEIAHTFHDFVVDQVSYVSRGDHQTAYGALVAKEAICAGYARAYQLLMNRAGIRCWYVSGQSYDPNGILVTHSWNLSFLDGKCYYSDATWDDQNTELFHEYLNLSLEEISKTHFTDTTLLPAPCGHDDYTFFLMSDDVGVCDIRDHKDVKDVAKCFEIKKQNGKNVEYYCTIHYHDDDFNQWLNDNALAIVQELGFASVDSIGIIELGLEHHVTITGVLKDSPATPPVTTDPVTPPPATPPSTPTVSNPTTPTTPEQSTPTTPSSPTTPSAPTTGTQPSDSSEPTQGTNPPATTSPAQTTEPSQTTGSTETTSPASKPADPTSVPTTAKPTVPQGSGNQEESPGNPVVLIAIGVAACGGIGIAAFFIFRKRK